MALPIRQGATHKVVIGPVVAVGDGYTPVTTLALSTADEAEVILHDNGTVVDISGYTWAAITTADGYYHLTLQSGISNTVGHMTVVINDDSLCLPVRQDFIVVDTAIYDGIYADGATVIPANVTTWNGTAVATPDSAGHPKVTIKDGTGTGEINTASGRVGVNFADVAGVLTQANVGWVDSNSRVDVGSWVGNAVTASSTTNKPEVDIASIHDDATAASNLELMYDTTGYTDPTAPSSRAQVAALGTAAGTGLNFQVDDDNTDGAIKTVSFVGSQVGTFANTEAEDGTYHQISDAANVIDVVYGFSVGARVGVTVVWRGYLDGIGDTCTIKAYDFIGGDWEVVATIEGQSGSSNISKNVPLLTKHTGTSGDAGKVYLRFESANDTVLYTDQLLVEATVANQSVGYSGGYIHVNTSASNTSTTPYVDGTADNPVSNWTSAQILAASLGFDRFQISNNSTIALSQASDNYEMVGSGWNLNLGSRSIDNMYIRGAHITGTGEATSGQPTFENCTFGTATVPPSVLKRCGIGVGDGTFTGASAGEYVLEGCYSMVAGAGTPDFAFNGLGPTTGVNVRGWMGGSVWTLDNNVTLSLEVLAGGGQTITTGGGNVEVRGTMRALTVTMSGNDTVQFVGVTGPITLSGTTTGTANLYGVASDVTDTTSAATVTNKTVSRENINAEADTAISDAALATAASLTTVEGKIDTIDGIADAILADTGTDGVVISAAQAQAIADEILKRDVDNVEATANEHTLATIILAILESSRASTTWTIKRTDGATTHYTKTLTLDANANPVTGVN